MSGQASREYDVYDVAGRPLGRVVDPEGPPRLGVGAATVLLQPRPVGGGPSQG
ncbi:MAG TPA: hypothetical protein VFZ26_18280 [Gemmatimonadales bacterium]